jgi:hypothetical protein
MPAAPVPGSLFPATTTAPPGPAVRPATPTPAPAAVWCQSRPRTLENATCDPRTDAATTKPWLLPDTSVTWSEVRLTGVSLPAYRQVAPWADW